MGPPSEIVKDQGKWLKVVHDHQFGYIRNRTRYVKIREKLVAREDPKPIPKASKKINQEIEKHRAQINIFTLAETTLIDGLDTIDRAINDARKQISSYKKELIQIGSRIKTTAAASKKVKAKIDASHAYMLKRLTTVYKLNWLGTIHLLASAQSISELFQRKTALERILAYDEHVRRELIRNRASYDLLSQDLKVRQTAKIAVESKFTQQLDRLSRERVRRGTLLNEIRQKKSLGLAAIEALKRSARELDQAIHSFQPAEIRPASKTENKIEKIVC